ncbi:hypothetical protein FHT86_004196 [Rhizobium sp. BK313]|uniref:hypothetical protein n=1 Tax=Rhizobium sp. BK313 TaxID=2587081 RepID=UPI00105E9652|nr:hypothetical protein [Rhizobium sp. BK313]MBB3455888.1 hypothetical protein [Rhizobium sp. BK313]
MEIAIRYSGDCHEGVIAGTSIRAPLRVARRAIGKPLFEDFKAIYRTGPLIVETLRLTTIAAPKVLFSIKVFLEK